ncbi:MAG: hypothetical protein LW878_07895 [Proteobacteria bacterium]|nr:hypothetical protein [Pseudomonadota bacterium]
MSDKIKEQEWQQKLHQSYQNSDNLLQFIALTLDSITYRYLNDPQLKFTPPLILAESRETNLGVALKLVDVEIKEAVKVLAKSVPREQSPALVSRLWIELRELSADKGEVVVTSEVNWCHPEHLSDTKLKKIKTKKLVWDDLQQFRKGFPLALEEVCELFL